MYKICCVCIHWRPLFISIQTLLDYSFSRYYTQFKMYNDSSQCLTYFLAQSDRRIFFENLKMNLMKTAKIPVYENIALSVPKIY